MGNANEESERQFLAGQKFRIKYSVDHPDMFMLLEKLP
jgi:hypothetical protein